MFCGKVNFAADTQLVVSVGYVDSRKGPDLLVEAAAKVIEGHPASGLYLQVTRKRDVEATVRALIERSDSPHTLTPFRSRPDGLLSSASVYALPSREDPFPNVVALEAEVGVPVVAFEGATGASDFIVQHGGLLASAFDAASFAKVGELLDTFTPRTEYPATSRQYDLDLP